MISKINGQESVKTAIVDNTQWELEEEIKKLYCTDIKKIRTGIIR